MIVFPLYYIALPFLFLFGVWLFFSLFNIFHALKFGYINYISYFMTFILVGSTIIVLYIAYTQLADINWTREIIFQL